MQIISRLSDSSKQVISRAKGLAVKEEHDGVWPEHIMLGALRDERLPVVQQLYELDVDVDHMRKSLETFLEREQASEPVPEDQLEFDERAQELLKAAALEADRNPPDEISPFHLLIGTLYEMGGFPATLLAEQDLTFRDLRQAYRNVRESVQSGSDLSLVVADQEGEEGEVEPEDGNGPDTSEEEAERREGLDVSEMEQSGDGDGVSEDSLADAVVALEGLIERARADLELAQRQLDALRQMLAQRGEDE